MFLMLSMLGGLGAIALPVIVHLLHRQQTTPIQWGAMRFLMESPLQQKRRHFIEHWLLLIVRVLVLGLLALALARPLFSNQFATPLGGAAGTDFAIVLDHSLSTGRLTPEGKTAFARAVEYVDQTARSLNPRDTLSVILAEHAPQALNDHPAARGSADLEKVRTALAALKPGLTDGHIADAVQAARQIVNHGRGAQKKIIVIGDDQKSGWQLDNPGAWKAATSGDGGRDRNLALFDLPIAIDETPANIAITGLEIQPRVISPNHPAQITATLARSGSASLPAIALELSVDGKRVNTQSITDIPAGTSRTVQFEYTFVKAGSHAVTLKADVADALEADNVAWLPVNVIERLPVLIIDGELTGAGGYQRSQFLLAAMQPEDEAAGGSLTKPTVISLSDAPQANFAPYSAVVLNDVPSLPAAVLARLYDYAESGHGVWVILGSHSQPGFMNDGLGKSGLFTGTFASTARTIDREPSAIVLQDGNHPSVSLLATSSKTAFAGASASMWWPLTNPSADARTILTTQSGEALVLDRPIGNAGGRVMLWTSPADGRANTLPLAGSFVPLVQETMLHLAGASVGATFGHQLESGQPIVHTASSAQKIISATLARVSDSASVPATLSTRAGRTTIRSDETHTPGLYEMRFVPSEIPQPIYYSVALPSSELDPAALADGDIEWLKKNASLQGRITGDQLGTITATHGSGQELWPALAVGVLAMLLLETFVTYRMIGLQATPARRPGGEG